MYERPQGGTSITGTFVVPPCTLECDLMPDAPGLVIVGGSIKSPRGKRYSVSGVGSTQQQAKRRALSELAEAQVLIQLRESSEFTHASSSGFGASTEHKHAWVHAVCELIERRALDDWWHNGSPTVAIPAPLTNRWDSQLEAIRQGVQTRTTQCFMLSALGSAPTAVAVSFDHNGKRIALGSATRLSVSDAINAAAREMCQMEFGYRLLAAKISAIETYQWNDVERKMVSKSNRITHERLAPFLNHLDEYSLLDHEALSVDALITNLHRDGCTVSNDWWFDDSSQAVVCHARFDETRVKARCHGSALSSSRTLYSQFGVAP